MDLVGPGAHQQAGDERVDHDALARTRRAGDEQMRHLREVDAAGVSGNVAPEGEGELRGRVAEVRLLRDPPQGNHVEVAVGDLDADDALARDGRLDAQRPGRQGHRQVVGKALDARDLDLRRRLTSYWVTTGPALTPTTDAAMLKLASLAVMIAALRSWSMPAPPILGAMSSRTPMGGLVQTYGSCGNAVPTDGDRFRRDAPPRPVRSRDRPRRRRPRRSQRRRRSDPPPAPRPATRRCC